MGFTLQQPASPARQTDTTQNPAMSTSSSSVVSSGLVDSDLAITREYEALVQPRITYHQYNHTASTGLPVYGDIPARTSRWTKLLMLQGLWCSFLRQEWRR